MAATTVICKVVCIVADENSKRYRTFASKLEGKKIDVLEESDNIGKMLGVMLRSLREGRKMKCYFYKEGICRLDIEFLPKKMD